MVEVSGRAFTEVDEMKLVDRQFRQLLERTFLRYQIVLTRLHLAASLRDLNSTSLYTERYLSCHATRHGSELKHWVVGTSSISRERRNDRVDTISHWSRR